MQVVERSQKDFLRDVLSIMPPAKHSQAQSENHALKSLDELPLASDFAGQATLD